MIIRFSIIIVHRNGVGMLDQCLNSVQKVVTSQDEIIVVDNGSSDRSVALVKEKFPEVKVIENNCNNGFAAANNQAIHISKGSYCLLINNDTQLSSKSLNSFETIFNEDQNVAVITPQLISANGKEQRSFGYFMKPLDEIIPKAFKHKRSPPQGGKLIDVDSVIGACMAVRQSAIQEVGLLDDEFFFYFEETHWCHRFKEHGYRVVLDKSTRVIHEKGESTRNVRKEAQLEMFRSRLLYYKKVFSNSTAMLLTAFKISRLLVNFIFATIFVTLSLALHKKTRYKWTAYGYQVLWFFLGKPRSWGLPDKCPIGYGQENDL
ncbi:MAG: glycosyltransferase family 2 protein [Phycisphaerales bacterium]|nr:glycosyltransferase family 2 protein [Phycisphaerales bacterium]